MPNSISLLVNNPFHSKAGTIFLSHQTIAFWTFPLIIKSKSCKAGGPRSWEKYLVFCEDSDTSEASICSAGKGRLESSSKGERPPLQGRGFRGTPISETHPHRCAKCNFHCQTLSISESWLLYRRVAVEVNAASLLLLFFPHFQILGLSFYAILSLIVGDEDLFQCYLSDINIISWIGNCLIWVHYLHPLVFNGIQQ